MKPGPERDEMSKVINQIHGDKDQLVPEAVRLAGETTVSAWKDGFNNALLLVLTEVLDLTPPKDEILQEEGYVL